ncbi:unnamed protein product [Paramecium sonneborni]|uniref:Uncharacterized protein n=1 Tax=Paramecium sonneborni TaxID=65129 RepID=A0A8S1PHW1_9CILI|nr:unnamed protein product [Paramecium sonneborni]
MQEIEIQQQIKAERLNDTFQSAKSLICRRAVDIVFQNIEYQVVDSKESKIQQKETKYFCVIMMNLSIKSQCYIESKWCQQNIIAEYSCCSCLKFLKLLNGVQSETFSNFTAFVMLYDVLLETSAPREVWQFLQIQIIEIQI